MSGTRGKYNGRKTSFRFSHPLLFLGQLDAEKLFLKQDFSLEFHSNEARPIG
jgi:hypothetical protein